MPFTIDPCLYAIHGEQGPRDCVRTLCVVLTLAATFRSSGVGLSAAHGGGGPPDAAMYHLVVKAFILSEKQIGGQNDCEGAMSQWLRG